MSSKRQSPTWWAMQEDIELSGEQEAFLDEVIDELALWRSSPHLRAGSVIRTARTVGELVERIKIKFEAYDRDEMTVRPDQPIRSIRQPGCTSGSTRWLVRRSC